MRRVFFAGALTGMVLILGVIFAFTRFGLGASGSSIDELTGSEQPQPAQPEVVPFPPLPDLTNYTPPPGCVLDRIYAKNGSVWSEALNRPIRPITIALEGGEQDIFPIDFYPMALNCHDSVQAVNPYIPSTPIIGQRCPGETFYSREGWVQGDCYGRLRPDIPLIIGTGDQILISPPLGPRAIIVSDTFTGE